MTGNPNILSYRDMCEVDESHDLPVLYTIRKNLLYAHTVEVDIGQRPSCFQYQRPLADVYGNGYLACIVTLFERRVPLTQS